MLINYRPIPNYSHLLIQAYYNDIMQFLHRKQMSAFQSICLISKLHTHVIGTFICPTIRSKQTTSISNKYSFSQKKPFPADFYFYALVGRRKNILVSDNFLAFIFVFPVTYQFLFCVCSRRKIRKYPQIFKPKRTTALSLKCKN